MLMKNAFLFFLVMLFSFSAWSQSIDMWETNVANGEGNTESGVAVSWTIGQLLGDVSNEEVSLVSTSGSILLSVKQNPQKQLMEVSLYPNPANEQVNIRWNENLQNVKVLVFNAAGAIVHNQKYSGESISINTAEMPDGFYFVKAFDGEKQIAAQKVIIQH